MLKRNDILNGNGKVKKTIKVSTPEWGDHVFVRRLPASELPLVTKIQKKSEGGKESEASLAVWWCIVGICDAKGKRLFRDTDHKALMEAPLGAIARCAMAFAEFNHLTEEADEKRTKN